MLPLGMNMGLVRVGGSLAPVSLLSASITSDGTYLRLTFSRPVSLVGNASDIVLTGNYRNLSGTTLTDGTAVIDVLMDAFPIYSDETFTLDIAADTFVDLSGNTLAVSAFPVTNNSTVLFKPASSIYTAYISELRASGDLWQNAGKTVPAVADGDPVRVIEDPVSGATQTAPSDASRMILTDMGGGKWGLTSDGVDDGYTPSAGITLSGGSTIAFEALQTNGAGNTRIIQSHTVNALITLRRTLFTVYVNADVRNSTLVSDSNPHTVVFKKAAAGNWSIRLDGANPGSITANANEFGLTGISYGTGLPPTAESFEGVLYALCVCNAELTGNDLSRIETVLGGLS